jgi:hypothetical protein
MMSLLKRKPKATPPVGRPPRFVQRDRDGNIIGHFANPQPYAQEVVPDNHPDIAAWQAAREAMLRPAKKIDIAALEARIAQLEEQLNGR